MFKYIRYVEKNTEYTKLTFIQKNEDVKVVRFDKPFVALEAESEALINELIAFQDARIACEEITYDEFKALVQTTTQYERALQLASERLEKNMSIIKDKYPLSERETWAVQKEEANKWKLTQNDEDAPFLKILAAAENDTVENFVIAVLANNEAYTILSANATSNKRLYQKELFKKLGL